MARVRPRRYVSVPVVNFGCYEKPFARTSIARTKGQRFGRASKGRQLTADERAAASAELRRRGVLQ
jgi:hypothetical protein